MRDKKELMRMNCADLTGEEISTLADYNLNCCDKCGCIDNSEELVWLEYHYEGKHIPKEMDDYTALCVNCHTELLDMKKPSKRVRELERELIDAYCDIINIIEDLNKDSQYTIDAYKNAQQRFRELGGDLGV